MKANGLFARRKRNFKITTDSNPRYLLAPNILNQNFKLSLNNQVWVLDITYIETKQGWMYLTVIIDLYNIKIVGRSMSADLTTEKTIMAALYMATNKTVLSDELIFQSDRGSQYACLL